MKKLLIFGLLAVLAALVIPATAQEEQKGTLYINSTPTLAKVYINGEYTGTTPLSLVLESGSYEIRIAKEGYYDFVKKINLTANETTYINATLTEIPTVTVTPTETPAAAPTPTTTTTTATTTVAKFRMGPTVTLRPVNDVISKDKPGIIELYFSNPSINDVTLTADVYVSVPSGIHISAEGFSVGGAAGTYHGHFVTPPGNDRTIYIYVYGEKTGEYVIHSEVVYYPDENKDAYQQISLTHPFKVTEPVTPTTTVTTTVTTRTPGFEAMFAIASLIVIVYLLRRL